MAVKTLLIVSYFKVYIPSLYMKIDNNENSLVLATLYF